MYWLWQLSCPVPLPANKDDEVEIETPIKKAGDAVEMVPSVGTHGWVPLFQINQW